MDQEQGEVVVAGMEPNDVKLARHVLASKRDPLAEDSQEQILARATIRYYRAMVGHA